MSYDGKSMEKKREMLILCRFRTTTSGFLYALRRLWWHDLHVPRRRALCYCHW